jgi:hypothetical protein
MGWRGTLVLGILLVVVGTYVWLGDMPERDTPRGEDLLGEPRTPGPDQPLRRLLDFDPRDVEGVQLERDGRVRQAQRSGGTWEGTATPAVVDDFLANMAKLSVVMDITAASPELKDYGLEPPQSVVQLRLRGHDARLVLQLGDRNPSVTGVYARIGNSGPVVLAGALVAWEFDKLFKALDEAAVQ